MQTTTEKSVDVLNKLVEINNDRIEGYDHASKETDQIDLKSLFAQFAATSRKCKEELTSELRNLGGNPTQGTSTSGKLYRVWMDIKAAITNKDRKAILGSCEFGEDVAVKAYEDTLKDNREDLSTEQHQMLSRHHTIIKAEHDRVRNLRDAAK